MHVQRFLDLQKCVVSRKMDSFGVTGVSCIDENINSSVVYIYFYWCCAMNDGAVY